MAIELVPAKMEQAPELGRICYEAFLDISTRHGFPPDFHSPEFAQAVIGMLLRSEAYYSVAAMAEGKPAGSNFLMTADAVGAVGPITVDVPQQGRGIGRELMLNVLDYARQNGIGMVRLLQDSFNMRSLALYASLGFDTKHACALMEPPPAPAADGSARLATLADLPAIEELSTRIYKVSRRNEVAGSIGGPFQPWVRERGGRVVAYLSMGMAGHGVAESEEDALVLAQHAAAQTAPEMRRCFCPLRQGSLYRRLLAAGFRNVKVMNLMALGPYEEPDGVWMPSVLF